MALLYDREFRIDPPLEVPVRRMNTISRAAMLEVGFYWIINFRRKHFQPGAAGRYQYQQRKQKYTEYKRRVRGHTEPLVWSGEAKRRALGPVYPRSFPTRVNANLPTPHYVKIRSQRGKPPMGDEMTRTTNEENEILSNRYHDVLEAQITDYVEGRKR